MAIVKLTHADGTTYGGCQWGEGVEHSAPGVGELCSAGWLHAYEADTEEDASLIAVFVNPLHGNFDLKTAILWRCEGDIGKRALDWKVGGTRIRTIFPISLPQMTIEQRVEIAIRISLSIYQEVKYKKWANDWISDNNRTYAAACAAYAAANAVAAACAAYAAANAVAADAAAYADAYAVAADAAAYAAANAGAKIDLAAIIRQVIGEE